MNRSLVICLLFAIATAMAAAAAALLAGWGWLAALGLYSGVGSTSLLVFSLARAAAPRSTPVGRPADDAGKDPVYA